uniref:hypothetical protein n=1 Tax=Flavobacterium sp. TaxID=239 RepID=UPI0040470810
MKVFKNSIRIIIIIIIPFLLLGCSSKISKYYNYNRFINNYNIHVINDSLQLYFKSPADINYITNRNELKKILKKSTIKIKDSVLIYGQTNDPPYEYFVTISNKESYSIPQNIIHYDTLVNKKNIRFIGNALEPNSQKTLNADLKSIFKSLEIGASYRKNISTIMDIVTKYHNSNRYYSALKELIHFPCYDKQEEWTRLQMALTFSSFLGDNEYYNSFLEKLESNFTKNDTIATIINENVITHNVIDQIIEEAKKHKIVMVNENHFYPNHRLLIIDLLPKLKEIGYNYLALEALGEKQDSILNLKNSYPTLSTGFYTKEQNFSNLIRNAKKLGFKFVAYENVDSNKNREVGQAENLYNKTFKTDANSKVLVLAGIDHILEKPTKNGKEWMASIFKNKYHIDPLTISQTHLNSYRKFHQFNYGMITGNLFVKDRLNAVDFLVLNNQKNRQLYEFYFFEYKNKFSEEIQISLFNNNEIINKYDFNNKLPYFTTLIKSKSKVKLPISKVHKSLLVVSDKNGNIIHKEIL